jgi:hypothetical protein
MFTELCEELLDLTAVSKGHGHAQFAVVDDPGCSGGCSSAACVVLCSFLSHVCW